MIAESLLFELLQITIDNRQQLSSTPTTKEWEDVLVLSVKHSLVGVVFSGVEKLPKDQWPTKRIVLTWMGYVSQIEQRNALTTDVCRQISMQFENDGFDICILKGQANHAYYQNNLGSRRSCGDVDLWVVPRNGYKNPVKKTINYLQYNYEMTGLCYLHASIEDIRGVPIEIHFHPSFMNAPLKNRRFLKCFDNIEECVCKKSIDGICELQTLVIDKDLIYQMNHIYRHLLDEGVGLRQVLDYYMLLKFWNHNHVCSKAEMMKIITSLGMKRFAGALMYVLSEVFAMPNGFLLCKPSENDGRFLLNEILIAGNFGQDDPRMTNIPIQEGRFSYQLSKAWRRIKRNTRFFSRYPEEVFWEPIARTSHYIWKILKLWNF